MSVDTVSVICPHCGHDRVFPLGQRGVFFVFECAECHELLELQARETVAERLARCADRLERCVNALEGGTV